MNNHVAELEMHPEDIYTAMQNEEAAKKSLDEYEKEDKVEEDARPSAVEGTVMYEEDDYASPDYDPVNNPRHYTLYNDLEVIQLTEQMNFNKGNAVNHVARAEFKGDELQDLEKARWYIDREISRLRKNQER